MLAALGMDVTNVAKIIQNLDKWDRLLETIPDGNNHTQKMHCINESGVADLATLVSDLNPGTFIGSRIFKA